MKVPTNQPKNLPMVVPEPGQNNNSKSEGPHQAPASSLTAVASPTEAKTRRAKAIRYLMKEYSLVTSSDGRIYASEKFTPNLPTYSIDSPSFGRVVRKLAFTKDQSLLLTDDDIKEVLGQTRALAELIGTKQRVWLQVAEIEGGIEIDLGDAAHTRVQVTAMGVKVLHSNALSLFYRTPNMAPFTKPSKKGDITKLLSYLNLGEADQWLLIVWIAYTLAHPKIPTTSYVFLVLRGDRGMGKSTLNRLLSMLVAPSIIGVQSFPASTKDLSISAQNAHCLYYDNLRQLTTAQSDALCIASTSGHLSSRALYTDDQEAMRMLHCAMVLNGIHAFVDEPDLAQRCLALQLLKLDSHNRVSERELAGRFSKDLPEIFRGLLDFISAIFRALPDVTPVHQERMIDFAHWLAAAEKVMHFKPGFLQGRYSRSLVSAVESNLEDNPLAIAVIRFAKQQKSWTDTPQRAWQELSNFAGPQVTTTREWPPNSISLSLQLKKLKHKLSGAGVDIDIGQRGKQRQIAISYTGKNS